MDRTLIYAIAFADILLAFVIIYGRNSPFRGRKRK